MTLRELETLLARFRDQGATDETPVRVSAYITGTFFFDPVYYADRDSISL